MTAAIRESVYKLLVLTLLTIPIWAGAGDLSAAVDSDHRPADNRARDQARHPLATLEFFGIREDMTVVEISPGGGWYTEILAPFLRDQGTLYAANYDPESEVEYYRVNANRFSTSCGPIRKFTIGSFPRYSILRQSWRQRPRVVPTWS